MSDEMPAARETTHSMAVAYIAKLVIGAIVAWYGLLALGIPSPKWAVISMIVVSDPTLGQMRANLRVRAINTLVGCAIACAVLLLIGANLAAMLIAIAASAGVAMSVERYPSSWRLAPATTVLLIVAAFDQTGADRELQLVLLRAGEVIAGGGVAIAVAIAFDSARRFAPR